MSIPIISEVIKAVASPILSIIDKAVPNKDQANQLKADITNALISFDTKKLEKSADVIIAEANGDSWLQRNWRPITMLTFVFIVFNNYILAPYIMLFFDTDVMLETPPDLWDLIKIGLGGYVVGRSAEKVAKNWKANS